MVQTPTKLTPTQIRQKLAEALKFGDAALLDRCAVAKDGFVDFCLCDEPKQAPVTTA